MEALAVLPIAAAPVIAGVIEVVKTAGLPSRFGGLTALGLGIAVGVGAVLEGIVDVSVLEGTLSGAAAGLAAVGAYETYDRGRRRLRR